MSEMPQNKPQALSDLPRDELVEYGRGLGLELPDDAKPGEALRLIRERQELLVALDRQALLDVCVWARRPVRQSASKEELAREIVRISQMRFDGLGHEGLVALARLRGLPAEPEESDAVIIGRLRAAEPLVDKIRRKRRAIVGSLLSKLVDRQESATGGEYQFLPEDCRPAQLRQQIEERGVMGGIASRIRGVADDYVREKLDEIETRIDRKLDEIDRRLSEWRDREIANRLRIIKITLVASILVAALSLGYSALRKTIGGSEHRPPAAGTVPGGEQGGSSGRPRQ